MQDALIQQGAHVVTEAACGAPASIWADAGLAPCGSAERVQSGPIQKHFGSAAHVPSLDALVGKYHPNLVVIGSGDTMAGYGQATLPVDWVGERIQALIGHIRASNLPCIWIGPGWGTEGGPYFKTYARVRQMNEYLITHVAPCHYVDSTKFAQPGEWSTFDGQHYTLASYQKWGLAIDQDILELAKSK